MNFLSNLPGARCRVAASLAESMSSLLHPLDTFEINLVVIPITATGVH